jgi:retron-type reverse transcriptase
VKRYGNLFEKIASPVNITLAHLNARRGKGHYNEVKLVNENQEGYITKLSRALHEKTFTTSTYETKIIHEPKCRVIYRLPYYPDRIVHHAVMQVIQPIWDKIFIYDLYSSVPGKGLHLGSQRLREFLKDTTNTKYCLKFDISKFYPSVDHNILLGLIEKKIKCKNTLWLLEDVIRSTDGSKNIPIGNYLSQYFGNIYLNEFDHWLKEQKRVKYYIRYCDDGIILSKDKSTLNALLDGIQSYLKEKLDLTLNHKTQIFPVDTRGIDFLGYRTFRTHVLLRKSSARRLTEKINKIVAHPDRYGDQTIVSSIMSYIGWLSHCNCKNLLNSRILQNPELVAIMERSSHSLGINNPLDKVILKYG